MSDPRQALQDWIVDTLNDESPSVGCTFYDRVPTADPFPRGTVGPGQTIPGEDDDQDGGCTGTYEIFLQLDIWSRKPGYHEAAQIAAAVRERLHHAAVTLAGYTVALLECRSVDMSRDPDGLTSRARMEFRALIEDA